MMDVFEVIRNRRSIRKFKSDPISDELITKILDAARWAPTGGNIQPWEFIVVKDPRIVELIKMFSPGYLGESPVIVVVCSNKKRAFEIGGYLARDYLSVFDCAAATQNMVLAAYSLGIGTCIIKSFSSAAVKEILGLPQGVEPEVLVALGYPESEPEPPPRRPLEEVVFLNIYGRKYQQVEKSG